MAARPKRCVALFSGGLDSMLAVRAMQRQGIEVEGVHFQTVFTSSQDRAARSAEVLQIRLTTLTPDDDYFELIKYPRFGYSQEVAPCVDCRIVMLQQAKRHLEQTGADFMISGEVLGQRLAQKPKDLEVVAFHAQLEDLLLRPLSAKLLAPTLPEREGWVDRTQLQAIRGPGRRPLLTLAEQWGLEAVPQPSSGCALTEPLLAQKVQELLNFDIGATREDFELLRVGRHFRFDDRTKVVVGRHDADNQQLARWAERPSSRVSAVLSPTNFKGPRAIVVGELTDAVRVFAESLIQQFSKPGQTDSPAIQLQQP